MPMIRFNCSCGNSFRKLYRAGAEVPALFLCQCGLEAKRVLQGPSGVDTKITIDPGHYARAVEIDVNAIKDGQNRARFMQNLRETPDKKKKS